MSKVEMIRQTFAFLTRGTGFDKVLQKLVVKEATEGRCVCELKVGDEHTNRGKTLHGGMTATLVDMVSTAALMTKENMGPGVSVNINVSYMQPAFIGNDLIIDSSVIKLGKTLAFLSVEIKDKASNKLIATGSHTKFCLKSK
ncbi:hypothetical protein HELRODRAFT_75909 [Helobdella robusta]|uniref:Acyl-coenzyme A thioesterase 13 n=1 Tax=Helobdella robusta TaxID=6412 RepID=T1G2C4_HELRO|nr:hypothetical protein HELRODRAFT_75909 [Helobdella robusta]ESO07537.1 hypothetical protein HELRODRAFT_75909 [Helobdella robusta]